MAIVPSPLAMSLGSRACTEFSTPSTLTSYIARQSAGSAVATGSAPTAQGEPDAAAPPNAPTRPARDAPSASSQPRPEPPAQAVVADPGARPAINVCSTDPPQVPLANFATGHTARCELGLVLAVPADEGFWIRSGLGSRVWVQLTVAGESPAWVRPGQRVSFIGSVVGHGADYPAEVGLDLEDGAAELRRQRAHVELGAADLAIMAPEP